MEIVFIERVAVLFCVVPSIVKFHNGAEALRLKFCDAGVVPLPIVSVCPPLELFTVELCGVINISAYVVLPLCTIIRLPPDTLNMLPEFTTSKDPLEVFKEFPFTVIVPPDWLNHRDPRVFEVFLRIWPSTFREPPEIFISGFPAAAYSISLLEPDPFPIFTTPVFRTSRRPRRIKSAALLLAAPILIMPALADKQPETGIVKGLDVVRVIVSGADKRKVPLLIVSAVANAVLSENAFTVVSRIEFLSVPLFTLKILNSVRTAVVPLICLLSAPVNETLQI